MGSCASSFSKLKPYQTHDSSFSDIKGIKSVRERSSRIDSHDCKIIHSIIQSVVESSRDAQVGKLNKKLNGHIDRILPTLRCLIMRNNQEDPYEIIKLKQIVKEESFWLLIMLNLIDKIEIDDPLGPSLISIFLEETPLPTQDQVNLLMEKIVIDNKAYSEKIERNILIVLSCLIQKVSGTPTAQCLMDGNIEFALRCLKYGYEQQVQDDSSFSKSKMSVLLFALIALEKFSLSNAESRFRLHNRLNTYANGKNPLIGLAEWSADETPVRHQIGFMSQYLLDNIYTPENHVYGCFTTNNSLINVRLNDIDASENLKISPDGLEARNDTLSFESVRSTFSATKDVWFYEVTLLTSGIMQIGFATRAANFLNHLGYGIGDDEHSVGYDGCRNLIWHRASYETITGEPKAWREGDVIGFLLDLDHKRISFYHNGRLVAPVHTEIFRSVSEGTGIFPAASFMTFQHVNFNFGHKPFKYPPSDVQFKNFNDEGVLSNDNRIVLPKKKKLEILKQMVIKEDACTLCCENMSNVVLKPCLHKNFCQTCVEKLKTCPICRADIKDFDLIST